MESILSCRVPRTLNKIWDTTSKLKTRGEDDSQELSVKDGKRENEIISTGEFLPQKDPLCFIEGPSVFTRSRQTRREIGAKELGQAYNQTEQVMTIMKNYSIRPSALLCLTSILANIPWAVLRDSDAIKEVHPSAKAVPADQIIGSLGTSIETFNGEALTIKE